MGRIAAVTAAILFAVFLVISLLLIYLVSGQDQASEVPLWLRNIETWAGIFGSVITALAIVVGGIVTYYRFIKERTHATSIQPAISYSMVQEEDVIYLRISASANNIGQSKVDINHDFTALRVSTRKYRDDNWTLQRIEGVLAEQDWIEPGETIGEPVWVEMFKSDYVAIRLDLYISESEGRGWLTSEIVGLVPRRSNDEDGVN